MDTKQDNRRTDVVRCEYCGEDYSVTYKRCPFCDDRANYTNDNGGGKRVATNKRGGGYGGGMAPVQIIGLALSIILIIAAIYIVFTVLSPLLGKNNPSGSESKPGVSTSQSAPSVSQSQGSSSGEVSIPSPGSSSVITPIVSATSISIKKPDITLQPDEKAKLVAILTPADCEDTIVWTSSNENALSVEQDGTVINRNSGSKQVNVTVTAQVGELKATCIVRCKGGSTSSGTTGGDGGTSTGDPVASGTKGTVTGVTSGLRIRSGPGTNHSVQDTALNGAVLTILEETADGWYKISYTGAGGATKTGYVSKDYVKIN